MHRTVRKGFNCISSVRSVRVWVRTTAAAATTVAAVAYNIKWCTQCFSQDVYTHCVSCYTHCYLNSITTFICSFNNLRLILQCRLRWIIPWWVGMVLWRHLWLVWLWRIASWALGWVTRLCIGYLTRLPWILHHLWISWLPYKRLSWLGSWWIRCFWGCLGSKYLLVDNLAVVLEVLMDIW